jgi:hypothetical protein
VGSGACAGCHNTEAAQWRQSQHQAAMAPATAQSVLGNFQNATFNYAGVTSAFFRRAGKFFVRTDGRDGNLADFEVKFTFGVYPLQQYLIEFPDGRLQGYPSPGMHAQRRTAASAGFTCIPMNASRTAMNCTGPGFARHEGWYFHASAL